MKRILLVLLSILTLVGCSKEERAIVNSKWVFDFDGSPYILEFTSKDDVRVYETDANYVFKGSLTESTYSYDNGTIYFGEKLGVIDGTLIIFYRYYFKTATINNDVMTVKSSEEKIIIPIEDGEVKEPIVEDMGERTFTLMKL